MLDESSAVKMVLHIRYSHFYTQAYTPAAQNFATCLDSKTKYKKKTIVESSLYLLLENGIMI